MLKNRRKTLIVSNLQFRLIIICMVLIIGISAILIVSLFMLLKNNIANLSIPGNLLYSPLYIVIIIAIVLYLVSLWILIHVSHRIYGPLYRLGQYIKDLVQGKKTEELKFRKGDAIDGLKEIYNNLCKVLEKTLHYDYNELVKIFSELEDILDKMYNKKIEERELYTELQSICGRIAKALDITAETIKK